MRRFVMALAFAGLTFGLAVPMFADDKPGKTEEGLKKECCEKVMLDRPFTEIAGKLPTAINDAGLILAGEIDWARLSRKGTRPGVETPRLEGAVSNVRTYLLASDKLVEKVLENPEKGFHIGKIVAFEQAGKAQLIVFKPVKMLEEAKKDGKMTEEKYNEHIKDAQDYERRLDQVIVKLKGERRD